MRELVVARQATEERRDRELWHAWHVAVLTRVPGKDFPTLEKLLHKKSAPRRQSPAEQVAMWQVIAAQFGGTFRPMDPAAYAKVIRG